jgi:hypothetical protein
MPKSEDALDQARPRQKFSKAEKRAYAKQMFEQELLQPPKNPIKPLVLPKKPPHRRNEDDQKLITRVEERLARSSGRGVYIAGTPHYVGAFPKTPPDVHAPPRPPPDPRVAAATPATLSDPRYNPWHDLIRRMLEIP